MISLSFSALTDDADGAGAIPTIQDENTFDKLANWFSTLRNQLGYLSMAKNLEYTFLQGLYETVSANLQLLGYPKRYPDFDPDDFGGGSNNIYDNQVNAPKQSGFLAVNNTEM